MSHNYRYNFFFKISQIFAIFFNKNFFCGKSNVNNDLTKLQTVFTLNTFKFDILKINFSKILRFSNNFLGQGNVFQSILLYKNGRMTAYLILKKYLGTWICIIDLILALKMGQNLNKSQYDQFWTPP